MVPGAQAVGRTGPEGWVLVRLSQDGQITRCSDSEIKHNQLFLEWNEAEAGALIWLEVVRTWLGKTPRNAPRHIPM